MIDFIKQKKIVIIIVVLATILIGWKFFDSKKFKDFNEEDVIVSNITESKIKSENEEEDEMMAIHVTGEVNNPGVVKLKEGSRMEDLIKAAGGLTENADLSNVNLAFVVEDGMKVRIPSINDEDENFITKENGKGVIVSEEVESNLEDKININTASEIELEELPGIGASIASRIIEYRNKNGKFKNVEDIKNVAGIGESKFDKIKDLIKV